MVKMLGQISLLFSGNRKKGSNTQKKSGKLVSQSSGRKNMTGSRNSNRRKNQNTNSSNNRKPSGRKSNKSNNKSSADNTGCPGSLQECVNDCVPLKQLVAYTACVKVCGNRCNE